MDGFYVGFFVALLSFVVGVGIPSYQGIIDRFEKPVCVKQKVGKDTIKKCYELREVK